MMFLDCFVLSRRGTCGTKGSLLCLSVDLSTGLSTCTCAWVCNKPIGEVRKPQKAARLAMILQNLWCCVTVLVHLPSVHWKAEPLEHQPYYGGGTRTCSPTWFVTWDSLSVFIFEIISPLNDAVVVNKVEVWISYSLSSSLKMIKKKPFWKKRVYFTEQ